MNLKAKIEWRLSGERAGASTGPALAAGPATPPAPLLLPPLRHPLEASLFLRVPIPSSGAFCGQVCSGRGSPVHLSGPPRFPCPALNSGW